MRRCDDLLEQRTSRAELLHQLGRRARAVGRRLLAHAAVAADNVRVAQRREEHGLREELQPLRLGDLCRATHGAPDQQACTAWDWEWGVRHVWACRARRRSEARRTSAAAGACACPSSPECATHGARGQLGVSSAPSGRTRSTMSNHEEHGVGVEHPLVLHHLDGVLDFSVRLPLVPAPHTAHGLSSAPRGS